VLLLHGVSAHRKASTDTAQHRKKTRIYMVTMPGVRTHDHSVRLKLPLHLIKYHTTKPNSLLNKHHIVKIYWGSGSTAPRILNLGTRWRQMVSFTPLLHYNRDKSPRYPLDRRLGGTQSRSGRGGEQKKLHHRPCRQLSRGRPWEMTCWEFD
jgi:hypothetical protein